MPSGYLRVNSMKRSFEGSVFKSKERKGWIARLRYTDQDGVKREKKRVCLTHAIAQAKIKQLRREIEADSSDRKTFRQLDEFFRKKYVHEARFVGGKKISGFRQKLVAVEHYMDAALSFFGNRYLDSITYSDLQRYKEEIVNLRTIHGRARSVSDTNLFLKRLRRLFNIALEQGWLTVNPFARGESLIKESFEVERTRILSRDEELRLLNECKGKRAHLRPVLIFAIETACRKNEILSLRWSSVDMNRRCIRIESQNTKTLKSRLVPITDRVVEQLEVLWTNSVRRPNALVFTTGDFKHAFLSACERAGFDDVHFHDLRHTAITRMLEKGISPPLVMKISGHTQQKTFLRYVNQSEDSVYEIAMILNRAA